MPTTQSYHPGQIYDPNDPPVGDAEVPGTAYTNAGGRSASMTGNIFTKTNALIGKKSYEKTRGLRWSRVFYANFLMALLNGPLTAVSTAAGRKLATRYTGNIPASGRPCPCTNGRNTSVSRT